MIQKSQTQPENIMTGQMNIMTGQMNLIFRGRMLWRDMVTWLTMYMFSLYGGYPNQQAISNQIYKLPLDYGNVMRLIFGDKVSQDFIYLVSQYVIILEYLFQAQMSGDQNAAANYTQQLYQNIAQRAAFLAQINPYWQENTWNTLLTTINNMLLEESTALLTKEYDKSVDIFNQMLSQSSIIGDYFSEGIFNYLTIDQTKKIPAAQLQGLPSTFSTNILARSGSN